jgi:sugar phosphate isomerase/epimerase
MSKMTIGINLFSLRDQCKDSAGLRYTLARLGEIGYTAVQVSGMSLEPEEIAGLIKDSGLTCAATHMSWPQIRDNTEQVINIHKMYGCKHAAIGGLPQEYVQTASGIDRFAREILVPIQKLADAGISFSYHNHHHEFIKIGNKTWLEMLYERIGPKHLYAEIDTYWVQTGGGDPVQWIRKMAGRQSLLHVKDKAIAMGGDQRFAPVGSGNLDWPGILKAAEESGVEYVLVEQDEMYGCDPFEAVGASYKFLASMGLL